MQESIQNSHDLQRVFIIDEAHRSYDPKGCFYANLIECDKTAIKIALTGTPLLEDNAQDKATKKLLATTCTPILIQNPLKTDTP
ncbi:hypothetical protein COL0001_14620 [Helicobacter pylori]